MNSQKCCKLDKEMDHIRGGCKRDGEKVRAWTSAQWKGMWCSVHIITFPNSFSWF